MKLARLELSKFKTFQREQLDFAPITLLTGANSSGKTSVLQALCAITQARDSGPAFPTDFRLNGPLARLGDFRNVINGHISKGSFGVGVEFLDGDEVVASSGVYRKADEGGAVATRAITIRDKQAEVEVAWNQKKHAYFLEYRPGVTPPEQQRALQLFGAGDLESIAEWPTVLGRIVQQSTPPKARTTESVLQEAVKSTNFDFDKIREFLRQQEEELRKGKIKLTGATFPEAMSEVRKLILVESAIARVRQRIARALRGVAYVGAVRALPLRYYAASTSLTGFDPYGEAFSLRLAQWKESNRERFHAVKEALIQLELATELNAETNLGEFVQVRVAPKDRKYSDTIADVGFGVSQALPILVADVGLPPREGVLLVNQPEVHLHPSSQALLGNYFASRLSSRQYIIETHSEYLITRFRILIAKKKIQPEDVRLYFFMPTPDSEGSLVRRIDIGSQGELINAPKDFFRTYISDSYELALSSFPET